MIGRAPLRAASSAIVSLALVVLAVLAVGPIVGARAADDPPVEPCDAGQTCDPVVTVTVTETPTPTSSPTAEPVVTKTVTVTPTPTPTSAPPPQSTGVPRLTEQPASVPTGQVGQVGQVQPPPAGQDQDPAPQVDLPPAELTPTPSPTPSFEEPAPETAAVEIRNAAPAYDKVTLSHTLAVPAVALVLLALLAWLLFEQRLRRMAHAAAIRKAGPRADGPHGFAGYPAAVPGYPPVVGFVPVAAYPAGYPHQPYGYPAPYGQPQGYGPQGFPQEPGQGGGPAYPPGAAAPPAVPWSGQQPEAWGATMGVHGEPGAEAAGRVGGAPGEPGSRDEALSDPAEPETEPGAVPEH